MPGPGRRYRANECTGGRAGEATASGEPGVRRAVVGPVLGWCRACVGPVLGRRRAAAGRWSGGGRAGGAYGRCTAGVRPPVREPVAPERRTTASPVHPFH
ncbi:hypothetical protein GCM10018785_74070 [Streptomyces longispororuber]|uniref:Uncharacterized protein n=1 Tax=Streptomyces longispororuber TaxID=68230 RepID=A0A919AE80_9ACTN|nr:hypothetical protein GCM10018785_74070 [Streptomyces longispororuber]